MHLPQRCVPLFVSCALCLPVVGQDQSVRPGINDAFRDPDIEESIDRFEGESREVSVRRKEIVKACRIEPGMVVADVGAGTGLFTRLFADAVGEKGRVYAVDISPKFLEHINRTCQQAGLRNVATIQCRVDSAELPTGKVDVVFICDTYHHFEFPDKTMSSIRRALKPDGRVIVIDFKRIPGESSEWVLGHVRAGQEVVEHEIERARLHRTDAEMPSLDENYLMEFEAVPVKSVGQTTEASGAAR